MSNIVDLDILRPEKKIVRIGGKDIDVSYIPCGITFDIDKIVRELSTIKESELGSNEEMTKHAFDLTIKLCVAFTSYKHPELDFEWFSDNTSPLQINAFAEAIREALVKSYQGVEEYQKN